MTTGELSESALDLLLTDIVVWPARVLHEPAEFGARAPMMVATNFATPRSLQHPTMLHRAI